MTCGRDWMSRHERHHRFRQDRRLADSIEDPRWPSTPVLVGIIVVLFALGFSLIWVSK